MLGHADDSLVGQLPRWIRLKTGRRRVGVDGALTKRPVSNNLHNWLVTCFKNPQN